MPLPEALLVEERQLRQILRSLADRPQQDKATMEEIEKQWIDVQHRIDLLDAEYAAFSAVNPLTLDEIQVRLPGDTALIVYFTDGEKITAFVVTRRGLTAYPFAFSQDDLALAFDGHGHLKRLLPAADGRLREPWSLGRLHTFLIAPFKERLAPFDRLYIVPHGQLHYLPFHAFFAPEDPSRCLMDDFEIVYAPSVTVLLDYCQAAYPTTAYPTTPYTGSMVGFNDGDLQHAEAEALAIADLMNGAALVGCDETMGAIRTQQPTDVCSISPVTHDLTQRIH